VVEGHSAPSVGGDQNANRGPDVFGTKRNQTQTSREAVGPGMYDVVFRHHASFFLNHASFFLTMITSGTCPWQRCNRGGVVLRAVFV